MLVALLYVLYDAPRECPQQARFETELRLRTSKVELVGEPKSDTRLSISIRRVRKQFIGFSSMHGEREFKGNNCESVVAAMALATALLLDPEARTTPVTAEELAAAPPPKTAEPEPEPAPPPEPVAPPEAPAPAPEPEPAPAPAEPPAVVVAPAPETPPPAPWAFTLLAGGGVSTAISGGLEPAVSISVSLRRGLLFGALTPLFLFGRSVTAAPGTAVYRGGGGRLDLGVAVDLGPLELRPGAQLTVLAVSISAPNAEEPRPGISVLVAPGVNAQVLVKLGAWRVAVDGGIGFNVRRERYVISDVGLVFAAPAAFGYASVGVGRTIP